MRLGLKSTVIKGIFSIVPFGLDSIFNNLFYIKINNYSIGKSHLLFNILFLRIIKKGIALVIVIYLVQLLNKNNYLFNPFLHVH